MLNLPPITKEKVENLAILCGHAINANNGRCALIEDALCKATTLCCQALEEIERLKQLINRDRTGLANSLNAVRQVLRGYSWIPAGEWGSYEWDERSEKALREEIGRCFDEAERLAIDGLQKSGRLADEAFHPKAKE